MTGRRSGVLPECSRASTWTRSWESGDGGRSLVRDELHLHGGRDAADGFSSSLPTLCRPSPSVRPRFGLRRGRGAGGGKGVGGGPPGRVGRAPTGGRPHSPLGF